MLNGIAAAITSRLPEVDLDPGKYKDKLPDSDSVVDGGNWLSTWFTTRSTAFWTIVVVLVLTFLIASALKKPMVKGAAIGALLLAIALVIHNS